MKVTVEVREEAFRTPKTLQQIEEDVRQAPAAGDARNRRRVGSPCHAPDPIAEVDGIMAATAIVHDLILVTRNTHDAARTGVRLLNPFELSAR